MQTVKHIKCDVFSLTCNHMMSQKLCTPHTPRTAVVYTMLDRAYTLLRCVAVGYPELFASSVIRTGDLKLATYRLRLNRGTVSLHTFVVS
jgi:hypothetical protein